MFRRIRNGCGWLALAALLHGCGGSSVAPTAADDLLDPEPLPAAGEPAEPISEPGPEPQARAGEAEPLQEEDAPMVPEQREVVYRVTPQGLVIQVDGARFTPSATIEKFKNGGYGITISVEAESIDDRTHSLLSPSLGPLAIAATVYDKNGVEAARHGDEREGAEQQFLMPGAPLTIERKWPSGSVKGPLWWGQRVQIHVGLWGLGVDGAAGRPVRKLFVIDMSGNANAKPTITPPDVH